MKLGKAGIFVALVLLVIPAAFAQTDLTEPLSWVFGPFINLFDQSGTLSTGTLVAITRFVIWLVIFAVIYSVLKNVSGLKWITNSIAMVLAFSFATISAIFTPAIWILQIGSTWAQIAALAMLGPIMLVLLWHAWKKRDVPALSAAELFVALALLEYFNVLFSIEYPPGNFISVEGIGRAPGVLSVVCQVALVVVAIALIIQLIRAIMRLTGGGTAAGGITTPGGPRTPTPPAEPMEVSFIRPTAGEHFATGIPVPIEILIAHGTANRVTYALRYQLNGAGPMHGIRSMTRLSDGHHHAPHVFTAPGHYILHLDVEDTQRRQHETRMVDLHIDGGPPPPGVLAIHITDPPAGNIPWGVPVTFDGALDGTGALEWRASWQHLVGGAWNDIRSRGPGAVGAIHAPHTFLHAGNYRVRFEAWDAHGGHQEEERNYSARGTRGIEIHFTDPPTGHHAAIGVNIAFRANITGSAAAIHWTALARTAGGRWATIHPLTAVNHGPGTFGDGPVGFGHAFAAAGDYEVRFFVLEDGSRRSHHDTRVVHVGGGPPPPPPGAFEIHLVRPPVTSAVNPGTNVHFEGELRHGTPNFSWRAKITELATGTSRRLKDERGTPNPAIDFREPFPNPGEYLINFEAIDSTGARADHSVHILVRPPRGALPPPWWHVEFRGTHDVRGARRMPVLVENRGMQVIQWTAIFDPAHLHVVDAAGNIISPGAVAPLARGDHRLLEVARGPGPMPVGANLVPLVIMGQMGRSRGTSQTDVRVV